MTERSESERAELLEERASLVAANEAATSWGAAVGARLERIMAIDRSLAAIAAALDQKLDALDPLEMLLDAARYAEWNGGSGSNPAWAKAARAAVAKARLAAQDQKPVADNMPDHGGADAELKLVRNLQSYLRVLRSSRERKIALEVWKSDIDLIERAISTLSKPAPVAANLTIAQGCADFSEAPSVPWPDPTPAMLDGDALFDAIWQTIKSWDVNVPAVYGGYCGANGNHARAIYDAVKSAPVAANASAENYRDAIDEALVTRFIGVAKGDAKAELNQIIKWEVAVALDPLVSSDAQALIDQGRNASAEARLKKVLRASHFTDTQLDDMYEDSKHDLNLVGSEIRQLIGDIRTARKALSAHPHASDCDKQGER